MYTYNSSYCLRDIPLKSIWECRTEVKKIEPMINMLFISVFALSNWYIIVDDPQPLSKTRKCLPTPLKTF